MDLIEDEPSEHKIYSMENDVIIFGKDKLSSSIYIANNIPKVINPAEINHIFDKIKFSERELVIFGIGPGLQPDLLSHYQKKCFVEGCGFEWLPFKESLNLINMIIDEKRKFIAIINKDPLG